MGSIIELVTAGVSKLVGLIPIWAGAKTEEQKAEILAKAKQLVDGLDEYHAKLTAQDKAAQDALQAEIDAATPAP